MSSPGTPERPAAPPTSAAAQTPYGPQTAAIRRFLQRFAGLSAADWDAAARAYAAAAETAAYVAADRDLARAVERTGRTAERDAVLGPLAQLVRLDPTPTVAEHPSEHGADANRADEDAPVGMHPVADAALAALLALVVRDVLSPRAFAALYAPFAATIPAATLDA